MTEKKLNKEQILVLKKIIEDGNKKEYALEVITNNDYVICKGEYKDVLVERFIETMDVSKKLIPYLDEEQIIKDMEIENYILEIDKDMYVFIY